MPADKKSTYKGFTEAQERAHKKYIARFVEVKIRMLPEERDVLKAHIERTGESANAFLHRAITARRRWSGTKQNKNDCKLIKYKS